MFCPVELEALIKQQSIQIFDFSDKKSERAKDMHLLKRLTMLLKNREVDPGKMIRRAHRQTSVCPSRWLHLCLTSCDERSTSGVVLGPLLFILYINGIDQNITKLHIAFMLMTLSCIAQHPTLDSALMQLQLVFGFVFTFAARSSWNDLQKESELGKLTSLDTFKGQLKGLVAGSSGCKHFDSFLNYG